MKYGIDIKTPAPSYPRKGDGWTPLLKSSTGRDGVRQTFDLFDDLVDYVDRLKASQPQLSTRVVQIDDSDESYRL